MTNKQEDKIIECAIAYADQVSSFNDFIHPEVIRRANALVEAVGEYWTAYNFRHNSEKEEGIIDEDGIWGRIIGREGK